ncbi:MAG: hypothetical protein ABUL62_18765 [Myxococcales bacterium]|jgi:hypothetical protein
MGRTLVWTALVVLVTFARPRAVLGADAPSANAPPPAAAPTTAPAGPHTAPAAPAPPVDKADEAFDEGRALLKDKRYSEACPKFEESLRQDPASGTLLALAYCQELSGLLATSRASYLAAARLAEREGHRDRQTAALERAQALASRVSRITVIVPHELMVLPGFHLLRDGIEFERASFGIAVATDGGNHAFEASAPGRVPWTTTVNLFAEGDQKSLMLPVLDSVAPGDSAAAHGGPLTNDAQERRSKVTLERVSLGLAAASVVGLAFGTGFALRANSKNDDSNADGHCANGCDAEGTRNRNQALSAARASTWSFVAGGALAAASITLYIHANSGSSRVGAAVSSKLQARVLPGGLQLSGSF